MKKEGSISYEKPQLVSYDLLGFAQGADPLTSSGGDIGEGCDSDFDE